MMSEEKAKEDMLLWMDVETTGLDPDRDRILEVEMRCTDMRGVRCVGGFRRVIGLKGRKASVTDENIKAWRMHCSNGLLEDALDGGYTEAATANALEEYVDSLAQSFILHPAGSNPQFDLDFIGRLCPNLPLHYHRIDMATLRDSLEAAGWDVKPEEETPVASAHRNRHMPRPRHPPIRAHHPPPGRPSGPIRRHGSSKVMDIAAVILLCAAILIGWMANRP